jgi:hypothetical protein
MSPSVGNIGLACQSHYWIRNGYIRWSTKITAKQAQRGYARDRADLADHGGTEAAELPASRRGLLARLFRR